MTIDRNTIFGFSSRVKKNLEYIAEQRAQGADVHEVTQLVTSLLGLIIYPYENYKNSGILNFKSIQLADLEQNGWPQWQFEPMYKPRTLRQLLRVLRNALAHRRIEFSSDSRTLQEVDVLVYDEDEDGDMYWACEINGAQLRDFAYRLSDLIDEKLRSH